MDRKEQILRAASKVFEKYGLLKTKLDDIAKKCGIKKTAVYYYFKNKDEIIQTMFMRDIKELKSQGLNKINACKTAIEKLRTYLYIRTKSVRYLKKYFDLFMKEDAPLIHRELALRERNKILKEEVEFLKEIIKEGIQNKEIKNIKSMPLIYILLGSTHTLGLEEYFYSTKLDIKKETDKIFEILLNGIRR